MKRGIRFSLLILAFLVLCFLAIHFAMYFLADRFCPKNVTAPSKVTLYVPTEGRALAEEILKQHFSYLGKGSQAYVFESEDGNYVLKFFRHERFSIPAILSPTGLPSFLKEIYEEKRAQKNLKLVHLRKSCLIAQEKMRKETGLVFIHLATSPSVLQTKQIHVKDKIGRKVSVDVENTDFILQKKALLPEDYFKQVKNLGKPEKIKQAFCKLEFLLKTSFQKGIEDHDCVIDKNIGFIDDDPIFIDIGSFTEKEEVKDPFVYQPKIKNILKNAPSML